MALVHKEKMAANSGGGTSQVQYSTHHRKGLNMDQKYSELMERVRNRTSQLKSWSDTSKNIKMSLTDKRHQSDLQDRLHLQRCLGRLQKAVRTCGLQSVMEKLECLAKQAGLKFNQNNLDCFFSQEGFYVQVSVSQNGEVREVTIAHGQSSPVGMSCPELQKILNDHDYEEFSSHLHGIAEMHQVGTDKKSKGGNLKSYISLQSLEIDLKNLAQLQSGISNVTNYIHKTPLGILTPRVGGRALKLTYFVTPYHLLDPKTKSIYNMSIEEITEHKLGRYVTVHIEASTPHKLQTIPLCSITKNTDGKSLPSFAQINQVNSISMPSVFVLKLDKPIPVALQLIRKIQQSTGIDIGMSQGKSGSLVSLIWEEATNKPWKDQAEEGTFVKLPDQLHSYYLNTGSQGSDELTGICISKIPFVHPTNVPQILLHLRQQLLFNTLIGSCIRCGVKGDSRNAIVFEVNPISLQHISVMFEHPLQDSMASVEFDLSELAAIKGKLYTLDEASEICPEDFPSKLIQRSLSIPITLRAIMLKATEQLTVPSVGLTITAKKLISKHESMDIDHSLISPNPYQNTAHRPTGYSGRTVSLVDHHLPGGELPVQHPHPVDPHSVDKVSRNPMLASLLDTAADSPENTGNPPGGHQSMLSVLLGDQPGSLPNPMAAPPMKPRKPRRPRSRSSTEKSPLSSPVAKRPRKMSQEEFNKELMQMDVEPSSSTYEMGLPLQAGGGDSDTSISHVSKLASSLDNIIKQETKPGLTTPSPQHSMDMASLLTDNDIKKERSSPGDSPHNMANKQRPSNSSLDDIIGNIGEMHADSDIFTGKDGHFTPTDFMSSSQRSDRSTPNTSADNAFKNESNDPLDFNTELLNPDPTFGDTLNPPNEESMDMAACDASAFGTSNAVAMLASKLVEKKPDVNKAKTTMPSSGSSSGSHQKHEIKKEKKYKSKHGEEKRLYKHKSVSSMKTSSGRTDSPQHVLDLSHKGSGDKNAQRSLSVNDKESVYNFESESSSQFRPSKSDKSEKKRKSSKYDESGDKKRKRDEYRKEKDKKRKYDESKSSSSSSEKHGYKTKIKIVTHGPDQFKIATTPTTPTPPDIKSPVLSSQSKPSDSKSHSSSSSLKSGSVKSSSPSLKSSSTSSSPSLNKPQSSSSKTSSMKSSSGVKLPYSNVKSSSSPSLKSSSSPNVKPSSSSSSSGARSSSSSSLKSSSSSSKGSVSPLVKVPSSSSTSKSSSSISGSAIPKHPPSTKYSHLSQGLKKPSSSIAKSSSPSLKTSGSLSKPISSSKPSSHSSSGSSVKSSRPPGHGSSSNPGIAKPRPSSTSSTPKQPGVQTSPASSGTGSESSSKSSARPSNRPITVRKEDSKMMTKTPTLKLKPITVPPKTGAQSLYNVQPSKGPTTPVSAPPIPHRTPPSATPPTPTTPTPNSGVSGLGKATKSRKGSLSAVIDRLATKQQSKSHEPQQQITEFKVLERKPEIVSFESKPTSNTPSKEKRSSESIAKEKSVMKLDLSKTKQSKPSTGVSTPTKDSSKSATSNTKVTTPNSKVSTPNSKVSTPNSKVPSSISKSSTPNTKVSTPTRPEKSILKTPDVKKPENIIPTLPRKTESANNATMPRKPENVNTPAMPRKSESVNVPMMPAKSLVLNEETGQMEPIKDTPKVPIDPSKQVIGTDSDDKSKLDARISGERKGLFQTLQEMEKRKSQSPLHTQGKANPDTNSKPTENLRPKSEATPKLSVNVNNKGPVEIDLISPDDSNGNDIPALVPQFSDSFPPSGNVNPKDERPPLSPIEQRIEPISPPIIEPKQRRLVPLSPNSEGSPGLVIDFPNTPKSNTISPLVKRTVTPQPKTISPTPNNTEQVQSEGVSGAATRTASPSVSNTIVGVGVSVSPARAKDLVKTHTPSPHSSPLMLDDELMDEAITGGFGSNS